MRTVTKGDENRRDCTVVDVLVVLATVGILVYGAAKRLAFGQHAEDHERVADVDREQERIDRRLKRTLWTLAVPIGLGAIGVAMYGGARCSFTVYIVATAVGAAAIAAGGVLGFLFGIPRALTSEAAPISAPKELDPRAPQYRANTNLEQISDWVTKILIGFGLAQGRAILDGFNDLTAALKPALGDDEAARVFGGAEVVYFVIIGFLCVYLYTRLRLQQDLAYAGRDAQAGRDAVQ